MADLDYSAFGLSDRYWTDFEFSVVDDNGDEKTIAFRVQFARNSRKFRNGVLNELEEKFQSARESFAADLDARRKRIDEDEALDDAGREAAIAELDREFGKRLREIAEQYDDEIFSAVVLDWDLKTVSGEPVDFHDADIRRQVLGLFPGMGKALIEHWRDTSAEGAIRKN